MGNQHNISTFLKKVAAGEGQGTSVYFLGVGGIGMSAIARYLNSRGVRVSGYDKTETELTKQLVQEGIAIHFEDDVEQIDKNAVFTVYTPAIPKDHKEYNWLLANESVVLKRSEVLGMITADAYNICVAGTHGKTTTSTMIAHVLTHSGFGCNAFLGGIAANYNTNFWSSERNVCVAEADEYDRSFLKLSPDVAVITAIDPDHLDIYGTAENFQSAFVEFSGKVKEGGWLIYKHGLEAAPQFKADNKLSYSLKDAAADCFATDIKIDNGAYRFDVMVAGQLIENIALPMGGLHNIENAVACITVAHQCGISAEKIREALAAFGGVKRRFEMVIRKEDMVMIDDYAHHPQELAALIGGAKGLYPAMKCTVVFQPHLFTRTRDFAEGFAASLSMADEVILLPIYPARELPIAGVESAMIARMMDEAKVVCCSKEELMDRIKIKKEAGELSLLIMAGAGDIDTLVAPIKKIIVS